jgi:hypothetical protein
MDLILVIGIFLVLSVYIIYLHFQLFKRQNLIESIVSKIIHFDKSKNKDDLVKLIQELNSNHLTNAISSSNIISEDIMKFIFDDEHTSELYIHYTGEELTAGKIIKEGFKFRHSLYKTSEKVQNDEIDLTFKHHQHKGYGKYVIVISIAKTIFDFYQNEISNMSRFVSIENVLTETVPYQDENEETIFTLSPYYIKGYFNYETGEITKNPSFNAKYNALVFQENVEKFKKEYLKVKAMKKH